MAVQVALTEPFTTIATGEVAGSVTAKNLPNVRSKFVNIKAAASNAGKVYVGVAGVTKAAGTDTATAGWELSAGDETGPLQIDNLNRLYIICDNAGDDVVYIVQR